MAHGIIVSTLHAGSSTRHVCLTISDLPPLLAQFSFSIGLRYFCGHVYFGGNVWGLITGEMMEIISDVFSNEYLEIKSYHYSHCEK